MQDTTLYPYTELLAAMNNDAAHECIAFYLHSKEYGMPFTFWTHANIETIMLFDAIKKTIDTIQAYHQRNHNGK